MKIIGLTGGIGSGKSEVSKILEKNNGYIIDADKINHTIMLKGNKAYDEILLAFGYSILDENKEIDRKKLGSIVFKDKAKLDALVKINHKYVIEKTHELIADIKKKPDNYKFIVIDAPLLIEAGLHKISDVIFVVDADIDVRINRVIKRDGINKTQTIERIKNQKTIDEMKKYADYIIHNNDSIENLYATVVEYLNKYVLNK